MVAALLGDERCASGYGGGDLLSVPAHDGRARAALQCGPSNQDGRRTNSPDDRPVRWPKQPGAGGTRKPTASVAADCLPGRCRPRLVILGTGWGGARLARDIDPGKYDITVISPRNHMVFTPLLGALAAADTPPTCWATAAGGTGGDSLPRCCSAVCRS